jgi:hypothetical protein
MEIIMSNTVSIIREALLKEISEYILPKLDLAQKLMSMRTNDGIEITVIDSNSNEILMLKVLISIESNTISVPNIMLPPSLNYKRIGKGILSLIYEISKRHEYRTLIVGLVPRFYKQLIARNALVVKEGDVVEITENTVLK